MDEAGLLGSWRYVVELSGVPFFKRPLAALGKKLNEGIVFEFKLGGVGDSRIGTVNQPAKWILAGTTLTIDTGFGEPSVGDYDALTDAFVMRCKKGEFSDELSRSSIRLIRVSR